MTTVEVVQKFWSLMQTNDFKSVGQVLSDDFVLEWPQSGERIRGRENYAAMNEVWDAWVPQGETPARATVEAKLAHPKYRVEIQLVAAAG